MAENAPQTAKDVVMAPGFFNQPEAKQIESIGAVYEPMKGLSADQQKKILSGLKLVTQHQAVSGSGATPPPTPTAPNAPTPPPGGEQSKPRLSPGLKPSPRDPQPGGPLLEFLRPKATKAVGSLFGTVSKLGGAQKETTEFATGMGEGLANVGIDMTSLGNLALTAGTALPAGKAGKFAKVWNIAKRLTSHWFTGQAGMDALFTEIPEAKAAYDAKDYRAMGEAVSKTLADLYFVRLGTKGASDAKRGGKAVATKEVLPAVGSPPPGPPEPTHIVSRETVNVGGKPKEVVERVKAGSAPAAASPVPTEPMSREQIERKIGDLEDSRTGKPTDHAIDKEIQTLTQTLRRMNPATSTDPVIAAQGWAERWKGAPPAPAKERPTPDVPVTGPRQGEARKQAAVDRAKNQDITQTWRTWGEGLGIRLAPEEIGEFPRQAPPVDRPIESSGRATPPPGPEPAAPIERGQSGSDLERNLNPDSQRFTVKKLPGIPSGATVIPRGMSPDGMLVDVVDSNNRTTQKTLPFRDSLDNMVRKGWMTKQRGPTGGPTEPVTQLPPAEKPPRPTQVRGLLEGPGSGGAPPPGPMKIPTPQELASAQRVPGMKMLPEAVHVRGAEKTPEQQVELAKGQPTEVISTFIERMKTGFLQQFAGVDIKALRPEQQQQVAEGYQAMQAYLKPYQEIVDQRSAKAKVGAPPKAGKASTPAAPSAVAPTSNPKEVASVSKSIFEQAASGGLESIKIVLKDSAGKELATQVFPVSTDPAALAEFVGKTPDAQQVHVEPEGKKMGILKWAKFLTGAEPPPEPSRSKK